MIYITAGHIDHGKTALIKALTGYDGDTHKDEKSRGITIEPSFIPFGNGTIIDVPGHEGLLCNMATVAGHIDVAILVVDAHEGVRRETIEHYKILELLCAKDGVVVLNKCDIATKEEIKTARKSIEQLCKNGFLHNADCIEVSAKTMLGIDALRAKLLSFTSEKALDENEMFFMPIDRVFTIQGAGTVATGTVYSGRIAKGGKIYQYPQGKAITVRNINVNSENVSSANVGQRAAVNINTDTKSVKKGDVLCSFAHLEYKCAFGARITLLNDNLPCEEMQLIIGTCESICRVQCKDGIALIKTKNPVAVYIGERFILRRMAAGEIVSAGEVICPFPTNIKRLDTHEYEELCAYNDGIESAVNYLLQNKIEIDIIRKNLIPYDVSNVISRHNKKEPDKNELTLQAKQLLDIYVQSGLTPPYLQDALIMARLPKELGGHIIKKLCFTYLIKLTDDMYMCKQAFDTAFDIICKQAENGGSTVASLRDELSISRKYARAILEYCDAEKLTINDNNTRYISR
ncbi:MAG: selenocysteine-specific translation elongation factor [Oscillospiraceae bacterium]